VNGRIGADSYPVTLVPPRAQVESPVSLALFIQWGVLTFSALLLILPFGTFSKLPPAVVIWLTTGIIFFLAAHSYKMAKEQGENPWLSPVSLLMSFYFFKYGLGAFSVYYWAQFPWEVYPGLSKTFESYGLEFNLPNACQLLLLGGMGLYLGARLSGHRIGNWLPSLRWQIDHSKFNHNLTLYTPIALLFFVVLQWYVPEAIRFVVLLFSWLVWVLMLIVSYRFFLSDSVDRLKWLALIILMYASLFSMFLTTGMREHALKPVLFIVLGYVLARGKAPWRFVIPALLALFVFISPWLSVYKVSKLTGPGRSVAERINETNEEIIAMSARGRFELALDGFVGRVAGSGPVFVSVYSMYYPDVYPFELGQSFVMELQSLMPRILWPEKPNLSAQLNQYTVAVGMNAEYDPYAETATAATFDAISEYYVNFGAPGIFFLSLLQGYYLSILYSWLVQRSNFEIGASIYLVLFFINHDFFSVVPTIVSHTRLLPVWLLMLYILSRKS